MNRRRAPLLTVAVMALVAIGLAACGGSSNSSDSASAAASTTASGTTASASDTVSTKSISGVGTVLVDSKGNALYTNNQDSGMNVACTGSCTAIWVPLMAPSSGQPTSSDQAVQAKLGMVKSKGGSQVTFGGKPLYTFVQDSSRTGDRQRLHRQLRWHELHLDGGQHGTGVLDHDHHERQQLGRWQQRRLRLLTRSRRQAAAPHNRSGLRPSLKVVRPGRR